MQVSIIVAVIVVIILIIGIALAIVYSRLEVSAPPAANIPVPRSDDDDISEDTSQGISEPISAPLVPAQFTAKHLSVLGTDLYLSWSDDYQAGSNLKFATYANTPDQQFTFNGGDFPGSLAIVSNKGNIPNVQRHMYLRWATSSGDLAAYNSYYCLLWDGYKPADTWYTDGYYFYNQAYSIYRGVPYHLAMVVDQNGNKALKCVGPDDVGSFPIVPVE